LLPLIYVSKKILGNYSTVFSCLKKEKKEREKRGRVRKKKNKERIKRTNVPIMRDFLATQVLSKFFKV
jgi:hypothetical protein